MDDPAKITICMSEIEIAQMWILQTMKRLRMFKVVLIVVLLSRLYFQV